MANNQNSFSLIELMVVIAIIGILSAIAIPNYRTYLIKTQIVEAISILTALASAGTIEYQTTGKVPSSINFGVVVTSNSPPIAYNGSRYVGALYYKNNVTNGSLVGQAYCVYVKNMAIPNLAPPSGGYWGNNDTLCMSVLNDNNGIVQKFCGRTATGSSVPAIYLPAGCNCAEVWGISQSSC